MRIQLPAETWIEILEWLRRRDLVKKLDKLWDREFTLIVQDWLHKYTKNVEIGKLLAMNNGLHVWNNDGSYWEEEEIPIAVDAELPQNIVSFKLILIRYLDSNILAFLRRTCPLFKNGICLRLWDNGLSTQVTLRHLVPILVSDGQQHIDSIALDCQCLQFLASNFPASLRFNARVLYIFDYTLSWEANAQLLLRWLFTRREDGQPRTLVLCEWVIHYATKIRERFLDPARQLASPFFVRFDEDGNVNGVQHLLPAIPPSVTENARTGEQLTVRKVKPADSLQWRWLITNCPFPPLLNNAAVNAAAGCLAKKKADEEELLNWDWIDQERIIWLHSPKIGPFNYEDGQQLVVDEEMTDEGTLRKKKKRT